MVSADLLREARLRAGLTQAQLGLRTGRPQSVISRWERGDVEPSLETLRSLVRACDLELTLGLAEYDDSYDSYIRRYLELSPSERVDLAAHRSRRLMALRDRIAGARVG